MARLTRGTGGRTSVLDARGSPRENRSTPGGASAMIGGMFRHAFLLGASAVADAAKAAVPVLAAAADGARS
ncbi:hypothetical protein [Streptomyces glaucus]